MEWIEVRETGDIYDKGKWSIVKAFFRVVLLEKRQKCFMHGGVSKVGKLHVEKAGERNRNNNFRWLVLFHARTFRAMKSGG
jgi:hypothetical protein